MLLLHQLSFPLRDTLILGTHILHDLDIPLYAYTSRLGCSTIRLYFTTQISHCTLLLHKSVIPHCTLILHDMIPLDTHSSVVRCMSVLV